MKLMTCPWCTVDLLAHPRIPIRKWNNRYQCASFDACSRRIKALPANTPLTVRDQAHIFAELIDGAEELAREKLGREPSAQETADELIPVLREVLK